MGAARPVVLILGPHREAVSGVSTHLNGLFASLLAGEFALVHFQIGSQGRSQGGIARLARLIASPPRLALAVLSRRAAIVHINCSLNARALWRDLAHLLVAKACGAKVLFQVHGGKLPRQFCGGSRLLAALLQRALSLADVLVVLGTVELEAYREFLRSETVVALPNGIESATYAGLVREPAARSDPPGTLRLLYLGRLARAKGLYELLQGLKIARAAGARARLVVAGDGPEEARLRRFAAEGGIEKHVSFAGPLFGAAKAAMLARSDALVLASYSEGLPYALLEGMGAGLPVIVTRVGAIPDVVAEGVHGLFVPAHDANAIARAIASLAADGELLARMGRACRQRIAGSYSLERVASDLGRLYAGILDIKQTKVLRRT
jgi:glycosyltransferase involved in cell wall biosynthesis